MEPVGVALRFVTAVNTHDVAGIAALLTEDHRFIDSLGAAFGGVAQVRAAWQAYFEMVPDYRMDVRETCSEGDLVILLGAARGTYAPERTLRPENAWETPAAWRAVIRGHRVAEWQVYADNEPIRRRIAARAGRDRRHSGGSEGGGER